LLSDLQGRTAATPPPLPAQSEPNATAAPAAATTIADVPAQPPEMAQVNGNGQYSLARQLGLKVRTIVIDPGHGGHDPGAMHNGLGGQTITLDVAIVLKKIL